MKIEIKLLSTTKRTVISMCNEKCLVNGKEKKINFDETIEKLINIVMSWQPKMINPFIVDGLNYSVKIEKDGTLYSYEGANSFPDNFSKFEKLVRGLEEC